MNGPRPSVTCPFWTLIAPPPCPDNAFTSCAWATWLSLVQRRGDAGLLPTLCTPVIVKPATAAVNTRGGNPPSCADPPQTAPAHSVGGPRGLLDHHQEA